MLYLAFSFWGIGPVLKILSDLINNAKFSLTNFYFICLGIGLVYGLFLNIFGSHHDIGAGADGGDIGNSDLSGHVHFSPFGPLTLATFIGSFGAIGLITLHGFNASPIISAVISGVLSSIIASITYTIFYKFFIISQASSVVSQNEVIGTNALVITPITKDSLGEIAYTGGGTRQTAMAKPFKEGEEFDKGEIIKIIKIVGNISFVEKIKKTE
ncbi:MAG: hypothetical protein HYU63_01715 [Armatimonadetes bacterium]|nr:hypothetical protein [Armatimonadota bacterium]